MSHLSPERLAALIDEQPTAAELSHLSGCRPCSRERGAFEALAEMSKGGLALGQPLTKWSKLAPALRRDGVIETGHGFGRVSRLSRGWLQAAAAVLLVVGGVAAGRLTSVESSSQANIGSADIGGFAEGGVPSFKSLEEAQALAARSQNVYQASMAYIASHDPASAALSTPAAIKTRLAALDQVTQITGAALEDAPYDSVINSVYLTALGQRDASMRQLNTASMRLQSY
jgi:hypothetical protein